MKELIYTDSLGRKFLVRLPKNRPDSDAKFGIVIGPPLLSGLALPVHVEIALHNELFNRGLLTLNDVRKRRSEIVNALQKALAIDAQKVYASFTSETGGNS